MTINIAIGNSDNKLTQSEWAEFCGHVNRAVEVSADTIYGVFYSLPNSRYQNASWTFAIDDICKQGLLNQLAYLRKEYRQDSIAWLEGETEFI